MRCCFPPAGRCEIKGRRGKQAGSRKHGPVSAGFVPPPSLAPLPVFHSLPAARPLSYTRRPLFIQKIGPGLRSLKCSSATLPPVPARLPARFTSNSRKTDSRAVGGRPKNGLWKKEKKEAIKLEDGKGEESNFGAQISEFPVGFCLLGTQANTHTPTPKARPVGKWANGRGGGEKGGPAGRGGRRRGGAGSGRGQS